jgi:hypothetical protein
MDMGSTFWRIGTRTHLGCERLGYVDAPIPLAGKDRDQKGQPRSGERGKSATGHCPHDTSPERDNEVLLRFRYALRTVVDVPARGA